MILCDNCYSPGACCKSFQLNPIFKDDEGIAGPMTYLMQNNLPFMPLRIDHTFARDDGSTWSRWRFSCPVLLPNGRCGDHEHRPQVCRSFEEGSDPLCVHYMGAEGTGEGL